MISAAACSGDACQTSGVDTVILVVIVVLAIAGVIRGLIFLRHRGQPPAPDPEVVKTRELQDSVSGTTRIETVKSTEVEAVSRLYRDLGWEVIQQSTAKSLGSKARVTITFRKP